MTSSDNPLKKSPKSSRGGIRSRLAGYSMKQQRILGPSISKEASNDEDCRPEDQSEELRVEDLKRVPQHVGAEINQDASLELSDVDPSVYKPKDFGQGSESTATTAIASSQGWNASTDLHNSVPLSPVAASIPVIPSPRPHSAPADRAVTPNSGRSFLKGKLKLGGFKASSTHGKNFLPDIKMPFDTSNSADNEVRLSENAAVNPQEDLTPEKESKGKIKKPFGMSFMGLKNFALGGGKNATDILPLDDEADRPQEADEVPKEEIMPPPKRGIHRTLTDQIAAGVSQQLEAAEHTLAEKEEAKRRRREKHQQRTKQRKAAKQGSARNMEPIEDDAEAAPDPDTKDPTKRPTRKHRSTHRNGRLDPEARERLKKHSAENEFRKRSTTRERRQQLLAAAKMDSSRAPKKQQGDSKRSLKDDEGKLNEEESRDLQESQEEEEEVPLPMPPKPVRTTSDPHARRQKKEEDVKLRERVRSRASISLHHESSSTLRDLLAKALDDEDDDEDATFAEDVLPDKPVVLEDRNALKMSKSDEEGHDSSSSLNLESLPGPKKRKEPLLQGSVAQLNTLKEAHASSTSITLDSLYGNSSHHTSTQGSSSLQASSGRSGNLSCHNVSSNRSNDYLQLLIDSVPTKYPTPPESPVPEKMAQGESKSRLEKSSRRLKKEVPEKQRRRRRSAERPSSQRKLKSKRGSSEPRDSSRRKSRVGLKDDINAKLAAKKFNDSLPDWALSDQKGNESLAQSDLGASSSGDTGEASFSDLVKPTTSSFSDLKPSTDSWSNPPQPPKRSTSSSRYHMYEKYMVDGELKPPSMKDLELNQLDDVGMEKRTEEAVEEKPNGVSKHKSEYGAVGQEATSKSVGHKTTKMKSNDIKNRSNTQKQKSSGDRFRHRKKDEDGPSSGDVPRKKSSHSSRGCAKVREEGIDKPKSTRRRRSLDDKDRKKDRPPKAKHKENTAIQELGKSLANFNW